MRARPGLCNAARPPPPRTHPHPTPTQPTNSVPVAGRGALARMPKLSPASSHAASAGPRSMSVRPTARRRPARLPHRDTLPGAPLALRSHRTLPCAYASCQTRLRRRGCRPTGGAVAARSRAWAATAAARRVTTVPLTWHTRSFHRSSWIPEARGQCLGTGPTHNNTVEAATGTPGTLQTPTRLHTGTHMHRRGWGAPACGQERGGATTCDTELCTATSRTVDQQRHQSQRSQHGPHTPPAMVMRCMIAYVWLSPQAAQSDAALGLAKALEGLGAPRPPSGVQRAHGMPRYGEGCPPPTASATQALPAAVPQFVESLRGNTGRPVPHV